MWSLEMAILDIRDSQEGVKGGVIIVKCCKSCFFCFKTLN